MVLGVRGEPGLQATIRDYGLGAGKKGLRRVGFSGRSKSGVAGDFYQFKSIGEAREELDLGTSLEQMDDLFKDSIDKGDPDKNLQEVLYYEMDVSGGVAAAGTVPAQTVGAGTATAVFGDTPYHNRSYAIEIMAAGDIGLTARYRLCRNYDVIDTDHQVWSEWRAFLITAPTKSRIYLEEAGVGAYIEFTEGVGDDFDLGDIWTWQTTAATPTVALAVESLEKLAQWRDISGLPIGGATDISIIGADIPFADTDWGDVHAIPTDEWDNNMWVVHVVVMAEAPTQGGGLYLTDTWITAMDLALGTHRAVTIPTNDYLNGAISICAHFGLRKTEIDKSEQVRCQVGATIGQLARGLWHWELGRTDTYVFRGESFIYPWNSADDNMHIKPTEPLEDYRLTVLNQAYGLVAYKPVGLGKIVTMDSYAMADPASDYFLIPYYRIVGASQHVARVWFAARIHTPGVSVDDAVLLNADFTAEIIDERIVDPNIPGDADTKPYSDASITMTPSPTVLVDRTIEYEWYIVPTSSQRELEGFTQLVTEIV